MCRMALQRNSLYGRMKKYKCLQARTLMKVYHIKPYYKAVFIKGYDKNNPKQISL